MLCCDSDDIIFEDDDDEYYDKFNDLTFKQFKVSEDFGFSKQLSQFIVEDDQPLTSIMSYLSVESNQDSKKLEEDNLVRIHADSVFKLGIHPLLMLSDLHRRKFPAKHNKSFTAGRYDPHTNVIKLLLFDSTIMDHNDKFNTLMSITRPILFSDNVVTNGSQDFYYWAHEFRDNMKSVSRIIKYKDILQFAPTNVAVMAPVIRFPGALGCIPIMGVNLPKIAIDIGCITNSQPSMANLKFKILKEIELLYEFLIDIETIKLAIKEIPHKYSDERLDYSFQLLAFKLLKNDSPKLVHEILFISKGRALLYRLLNALNVSMSCHLTYVIINAVCLYPLPPALIVDVLYNEQLADMISKMLSRTRLDNVRETFIIVLKSQFQIIHTFLGLSVVHAFFSTLCKKSPTHITYSECDIANHAINQLIFHLNNCNIPQTMVEEYKKRLNFLANVLSNIKSNNMLNSELKSLIKLCHEFPLDLEKIIY